MSKLNFYRPYISQKTPPMAHCYRPNKGIRLSCMHTSFLAGAHLSSNKNIQMFGFWVFLFARDDIF